MSKAMTNLTPASRRSLPGPDDISRIQLPNGIVILTRANVQSPSVVLSGYLGAGSVYDPPQKLGLAYFTALALMRGTQRFTFSEIFDRLESAGASLGFGASVHNTSFGGRALSEDLPLLFEMLSETLRRPTFPELYVERLRAQILTGLAIRNQDTADMASLEFDRLVFPGHPYGQPEDGYPETIRSISRADLVDYHHRHYGPQDMVITVVGAVTPEQVLEEATRTFGDWENPNPNSLPALPVITSPAETIRRHINIPGKFQTDLMIGSLGPCRNSPDYLPASLGNSVLGQFGMMGRIGEAVREKSGLAYYASTSLNAWILSGSWEVTAGVNPANVQRAVELIVSELQRFTREPVSLEELQDSQSNFVGRLPLALESNGGVANALLNLERFNLGLDYYLRYADLINSITPDMALETARRYLDPEKLIIVSAGTEG